MEVEKKFLVKRMPKLDWGNSYEIEQGYLSLDPEIRVRKKGNSFFITQKGNGDFVREEIEQSISKETYAILSQLVQGNLVTKTRFEIPIENGYLAELDIYHGNLSGLVTVEVEFEDDTRAKTDGIFVALGVAGGNEFAKKLGIITQKDRIVVNENMETNIPGIYACGDCVGGLLQISKSVYEGTKAGLQAIRYIRKENV